MIFGYVSGDNPGPNPEATFKYLISAVPFCLLLISFIISLFIKNVSNGNLESNNMSNSGVKHHG
jgi:glycoside/pentoside/hexuronide:cation symporter, GPH family